MIFFLILIPFATIGIVWAFWGKFLAYWEILLIFGVSLVAVVACKFVTEYIDSYAFEYWTNFCAKAVHDEHWTERYTTTSTDKKGHTHTQTHTVHHPDQYYVVCDGDGGNVSISKSEYREIVQKFSNETKTKNWHINQVSWGDGNTFTTVAGDKQVVVTQSRHYVNKVKKSRSVFNFPDVSKEDKQEYNLVDYPVVSTLHTPSILGSPTTNQTLENEFLCFENAKLGFSKQIRIWIIIFKNQPVDAALKQESYWVGGNKNELVLCIGIDNNESVKWGYVFSWSEEERLKVDIKNFIQEQQKLDLQLIIRYSADESSKRWKRKEFKDFNYLHIEPSPTALFLSLLFVLAINIGLAVYSVNNQYA